MATEFLEDLGLSPAEAARRLRELPPDKLLDTQQQTLLKLGTSGGVGRRDWLLPFQPLVDDEFLEQPPLDAIRSGLARDVSLMTGTTRDEWKLFGMIDPGLRGLDRAGLLRRLERQAGDAAMRIVATYEEAHPDASPADLFYAIESDRVFRIPALRLAEARLSRPDAGDDVFVYRFDWESPALGGALGACHAVELGFVFGVLDKPGMDFLAGGGPEAERLAGVTMDAWLAFARSGDPSHADLPGGRWARYDLERRSTLVLGPRCGLELDPGERERKAWEGVL